MTEALVGLAVMLALAFLRVPIAIAMGLVGFLGIWWMRGLNPSMASATTVVYESGFQYTLSVVPLFILMGNFVTRAGMSKELYRAAHTFVGHMRGGLAMSTVLACAGFGAICGSSIATAATMTKVAYPSMNDHRYSDELAAGVICRRRHARHPDPAVDDHGDLRDHDRHQHRQAVRCRRAARADRRRPALPGGAVHLLARSGRRTGRRTLELARAVARGQGRLGGRRALHRRHGRHLRRRLHRHRRRRHRRVRRLLLRARAAAPHPSALLERPGRQRAHDGDAVHDPGRRADLRQLRQLHVDAGRPEGLRHALPDQPDDGDDRDLHRST